MESYSCILVTRRLMLMKVKVCYARVRVTGTFSTSESTKTRRFKMKNWKNFPPVHVDGKPLYVSADSLFFFNASSMPLQETQPKFATCLSRPDLKIVAQNWIPKLPFSCGFMTTSRIKHKYLLNKWNCWQKVLAKLYDLSATNGWDFYIECIFTHPLKMDMKNLALPSPVSRKSGTRKLSISGHNDDIGSDLQISENVVLKHIHCPKTWWTFPYKNRDYAKHFDPLSRSSLARCTHEITERESTKLRHMLEVGQT